MWTITGIHDMREKTKHHLDAHLPDADSPERLQYLLSWIDSLAEQMSSESKLQRYLLIIFAVMHHMRAGGLTRKDVNHLIQVAYTILKLQRINPEKSRIKYLYWEVRQLESQLAVANSEHWRSAWLLGFAYRYIRADNHIDQVQYYLALAKRSMRLGQLNLTHKYLDTLESFELTKADYNLARLCRLMTFRIANDQERFEVVFQQLNAMPLDDGLTRFLHWQRLCFDGQQGQPLSHLYRSLKVNGTHHEGYFFLEGYLLGLALSPTKTIAALGKVQSRRRRWSLSRYGFLSKAAEVMCFCYDTTAPIEFRLERLSTALENRHQFKGIEREMLFLVAASNWLAGNRLYKLAELVGEEYTALSLKITNGTKRDCLNALTRAPYTLEGRNNREEEEHEQKLEFIELFTQPAS